MATVLDLLVPLQAAQANVSTASWSLTPPLAIYQAAKRHIDKYFHELLMGLIYATIFIIGSIYAIGRLVIMLLAFCINPQ